MKKEFNLKLSHAYTNIKITYNTLLLKNKAFNNYTYTFYKYIYLLSNIHFSYKHISIGHISP